MWRDAMKWDYVKQNEASVTKPCNAKEWNIVEAPSWGEDREKLGAGWKALTAESSMKRVFLPNLCTLSTTPFSTTSMDRSGSTSKSIVFKYFRRAKAASPRSCKPVDIKSGQCLGVNGSPRKWHKTSSSHDGEGSSVHTGDNEWLQVQVKDHLKNKNNTAV